MPPASRAWRVAELERLATAGVPGHSAFNTAWQDWLNLQNQVTTAWLIARSALERTESRGSHFRRDCPHFVCD